MGHRLSKIYTRTGDKGTTGLGDGSRVDKDDVRVEAFGSVDELNSLLGVLLTHALPDPLPEMLNEIQHTLFDLGAELCIPGHTVMTPGQVTQLEQWLDSLNEELSPLKEFILPGGSPSAAYCHLARTLCRRAERRTISLHRQQPLNNAAIGYLNRLSDLLFVMARWINKQAGSPDILWQPKRLKT